MPREARGGCPLNTLTVDFHAVSTEPKLVLTTATRGHRVRSVGADPQPLTRSSDFNPDPIFISALPSRSRHAVPSPTQTAHGMCAPRIPRPESGPETALGSPATSHGGQPNRGPPNGAAGQLCCPQLEPGGGQPELVSRTVTRTASNPSVHTSVDASVRSSTTLASNASVGQILADFGHASVKC